MTTPEKIDSLKENEVFVFGSNLNGNHAGGAAKLAQEKFGAIPGIGEGFMGQSYAFPTLDKNMDKASNRSIKKSATRLFASAKNNPNHMFLLTKVGCGIAGFEESEIAKFFKKMPENIIKPLNW